MSSVESISFDLAELYPESEEVEPLEFWSPITPAFDASATRIAVAVGRRVAIHDASSGHRLLELIVDGGCLAAGGEIDDGMLDQLISAKELHFSADGNFLIVRVEVMINNNDSHGAVDVFDLRSGAKIHTVVPFIPGNEGLDTSAGDENDGFDESGGVYLLAVSPDGARIVVGTLDEFIVVEISSGREVHRWTAPKARPQRVEVHPSNRVLALLSDVSVATADIESGETRLRFEPPAPDAWRAFLLKSPVSNVVFLPDDEALLFAVGVRNRNSLIETHHDASKVTTCALPEALTWHPMLVRDDRQSYWRPEPGTGRVKAKQHLRIHCVEPDGPVRAIGPVLPQSSLSFVALSRDGSRIAWVDKTMVHVCV
jgi:WD40 repeat protein